MLQVQFIHRRLVFQLWRRDKYPQCMLYSSRCSSWTRFLTSPVCCFDRCLVRWCRKLWFSRSCSPSLAVDFPFTLQRLPMVQTVQQIIETPPVAVRFFGGRSLLCVRVVQILRCRRGDDARAPTVAVLPQVLCGSHCRKLRTFRSCCSSSIFPVVVQRPTPMVLLVRKTIETPLLLLNTVIDVLVAQFVQVRTSSKAPCIWQSLVWCSLFAFGVQDYGLFWEFPSGMVSVCNTPSFDSGYMFGVSPRGLCLKYFTLFSWWALGDDFMLVSVFSAELGSTADTCTASVYSRLRFSRSFSVKMDSDPEVASASSSWTRLLTCASLCMSCSSCCKLWNFRSCSTLTR